MAMIEISNEEYHARPEMSASGLKQLYRSPAHFKYWKNNPTPPTDAMRFGTAAHTAILEPEKFNDEIVVAPNVNRRTKAGRVELDIFSQENKNKTIVSLDEHKKINDLQESVRNHARAAVYLENGYAELSGFFYIEGVACRIRPDWLPGNSFCLDLKTCKDASPVQFPKDCANLNYDIQAGLYTLGLKEITGEPHDFIFLAVEKEPPYAVAIYRADQEFLEIGQAKVRSLCKLYRQCIEKNEWPAFTKTMPLALPKWATRIAA